MSPHCVPEHSFPWGKRIPVGLTCSWWLTSLPTVLSGLLSRYFLQLSPAQVGFHPHLTLLICPNRSSCSLAFPYLFAQLICNPALTHCPDNEVETNWNGWMKRLAIVFQLLCSREVSMVSQGKPREILLSTPRPHKHKNVQKMNSLFIR